METHLKRNIRVIDGVVWRQYARSMYCDGWKTCGRCMRTIDRAIAIEEGWFYRPDFKPRCVNVLCCECADELTGLGGE